MEYLGCFHTASSLDIKFTSGSMPDSTRGLDDACGTITATDGSHPDTCYDSKDGKYIH